MHLLQVPRILSLAIAACQATLPWKLYWNSVLPNTPMPQAIRNFMDEKSNSVTVGGKGVGVRTGKPGKHIDVVVGQGGVSVNTERWSWIKAGKSGKHTGVGVGKGGVSVSTGHKGKPVYVGVKPGPDSFVYLYAATQDQFHHDPNVALSFLEKEMCTGTKMNLHFFESADAATFLPRQIADAIPFSSTKFPGSLNHFPCEATPEKGEEKHCATSLESVINYNTSKMGKKVQAISTEMAGNKAVVCHKQDLAYAVVYCHASQTTRAYTVPLLGFDGTKAKAVAI
uniref:BURP domain-containing protein n=1 Tax=Kalanchoe fedtschenkoi TaxID=63787 RepID=A0A7N0TAK1_KALFE